MLGDSTGTPAETTHHEAKNMVLLQNYLDPAHVAFDLPVASRKRLFEEFATILTSGQTNRGEDEQRQACEEVFEILLERERLGCTALGQGIALPHGRLASLSKPIISVARLKAPIDYDAPDGVPVWLAVCLMVPVDADEIHLGLLATLSARFSNEALVKDVRSAQTADEIYRLFLGAPP